MAGDTLQHQPRSSIYSSLHLRLNPTHSLLLWAFLPSYKYYSVINILICNVFSPWLSFYYRKLLIFQIWKLNYLISNFFIKYNKWVISSHIKLPSLWTNYLWMGYKFLFCYAIKYHYYLQKEYFFLFLDIIIVERAWQQLEGISCRTENHLQSQAWNKERKQRVAANFVSESMPQVI